MKFDLHIVQLDRDTCEVPGCRLKELREIDRFGVVMDWDHCIFLRNNKKGKPEFAKFVNNPFNMLRACSVCNRITHISDHWEAKEWLIDYHLDGEYRDEFLEWIRFKEDYEEWLENLPRNFSPNDMFRIYNYIANKLDEEKKVNDG